MQNTILKIQDKGSPLGLANEAGSALLTTLIALGFGLAIIATVSTLLTNMAKSQEGLGLNMDKSSIQKFIAVGIDCSTTITNLHGGCVNNGTITLAATQGVSDTLVANPSGDHGGTYFGGGGPGHRYDVYAQCSQCADGEGCRHKLVVMYRRNNESYTDLFAPSRLSKTALTDLSTCEVPF